MRQLWVGILFFFLQGTLVTKAEQNIAASRLCYGSENAPIIIVQYASPSCGICAKFMEKILPKLQKEFIDTGKVSLVSMEFPLNEVDMKISQIIRGSPSPCRYQKIIYETQHIWIKAKNPFQALKKILIENGLTIEEINRSLENEKFADDIVKSRFIAEKKYDIQGVPIFIIGAKEIDGLLSWRAFRKIILQALEHVKKGNPLKTFGIKNAPSEKRAG